jgi:hypothetical protein
MRPNVVERGAQALQMSPCAGMMFA